MPANNPRRRSRSLAAIFAVLLAVLSASKASAFSHSIKFLIGEVEAFSTRLELIENASSSICIATYQIRDDGSGGQLMAALVDAAARGVEVRLLVDAHPNSNNLPKPLMRYLAERGVCIKERPFDVRSKLELGRPRLHDKLFLVDNSTLIIGGRNLEQDYFGLGNRKYIDFDAIASGPIVGEVQSYFWERWSEPESATPRLVGPEEPKMLKKQVHADWNDRPYCEVVLEIEAWLAELRSCELQAADLSCRGVFAASEHEPCCVEFLRDFSTGSKRSPEAISSVILDQIDSAKRSVCISTPYFVIPLSLRNALHKAARRGVDVTVFTNSLDSTDQVVAHAGYANDRRRLIRNGITLYEKQGSDILHAKLIVIDGNKTIIGSHNLDMLSMKRNSEVGLLVSSKTFADDAMMLFRSLQDNSRCLNNQRLFRYEARNHNAPSEKLEKYRQLRFVVPFIRRYL